MKKTLFIIPIVILIIIMMLVSCSSIIDENQNVQTTTIITENTTEEVTQINNENQTIVTENNIETTHIQTEQSSFESTSIIIETTNDLSEETKIEIVSNDIAVVTTMEESTAIEATEETTFEETTATETTESGNLITEIRQTFWKTRTVNFEGNVFDENEYPHFWYYGEYGVGHVVLYQPCYEEPLEYDETVAGLTFHFFNFNEKLDFYCDGELYSLKDAYEKNLMSLDDLTRLHAQFVKYRYTISYGLQPGNYYIVPGYLKSVDVAEEVIAETTVIETTELQTTEEETTAIETTESGNLITEIRQAFWEKRTLRTEGMVLNENEYPHFWYYGEYGVGHIVLIETVIELPMFQDETVAGITFHYFNFDDRLELYCSGEFYSLGDAYEKNLISFDDLTRLLAQFEEYPYNVNHKLQPGDYYLVPEYSKSVDVVEDVIAETTVIETTELQTTEEETTATETTESSDLITEIRQAFWKTRTLNFEGNVFDENEYPNFWYYGEYGVGHVVLYQPRYLEPLEYDETVAGLTFHYFNFNEKLDFYCDGELYSLKDAYEKNMITLEDLTKLNNYFSSHPYYKDKAIFH